MRPRLGLAVLLGAVVLAGCDPRERPPRGVLPDSVLVEALVGVHLAAARASHTGEPVDSLRAAALGRVGTDSVALRQALDAYARRPEALVALYDRVLDRLAQSDETAFPSVPSDPLPSDP
jgi:hypothetical protein